MLSPQALTRRTGLASPLGSSLYTRQEITEFSKDPKLVAAFRAGIKAMRKLTDERNTSAFKYWHYSHWMPNSNPPDDMKLIFDQCKHDNPYFLPWHRGFLYFFEQIVRKESGDPRFALPYWDYYKDPTLPAIFTEETVSGEANPLYWADRKGTKVTGLEYGAFADTVTVFPWGWAKDAFEDLCKRNPHNRVHGQVGGSMGRVPTAPADPIFYVHHCNIDRYWSAWLAAGDGREMPPRGDLWWKQIFAYNLEGTWSLSIADMNDTEKLGYTFSDLSLPKPKPGALLPLRPGVVVRGSVDAAGPLALDLRPITIEIPLDARTADARFVDVVLEGVEMTALGEQGGYDYSVFANLPTTRTPVSEAGRFEIGGFGSFDLSMPQMTGMTVLSKGARTLRFSAASPGSTLALSFVGFSGGRVPLDAALIKIARISVTAR